MTLPPTRLHVLLATENDSALVLRRGPAKWVAAIKWNRDHDTFKLGQWLKGRIDDNHCDLSPDGRHFLYQAKKYDPKVGCAVFYTVMSRAPYLKALHYWAPKHYVSGGAFFDNELFWLSQSLPEVRSLSGFARLKDEPNLEAIISTFGHNIPTYRRQRDGWILQPDDYQRRDLWHKNQGDYTLALSTYNWRDKLANLYELKHGLDVVISSNEWTWADLDIPRNRLCFARDGCLYALNLKPGATQTLLHDFNAMQFEPRVAPY